MKNKEDRDRSKVQYIKRATRLVSRPRVVMGLLLIVAIPVFISLANKAVRENSEAIRQSINPLR
jgi:hypothetical protein